ncbi:MAG: tRNA (adenosine(37)-N6)-threonylcarbamoyltransferase complex dimerization subunit type 1 TsaB [Pseudomonadota bacterium]
MLVLALDTCFQACSVALAAGQLSSDPEAPNTLQQDTGQRGLGQRDPELQNTAQSVLAHRFTAMTTGHAEALIGMIDATLNEAGHKLADVDRIAVTHGPGSFTGTRVGLSAARAFKLVLGCEIVALDSLAVMAATAARIGDRDDPAHAIALDARRGMVHWRLCGPHATTQLLTCEQALETLEPLPTPLIAGSGGALLREIATKRNFTVRTTQPELLPDAFDLAIAAFALHPEPAAPAPVYARPPDAKPQDAKRLIRRG